MIWEHRRFENPTKHHHFAATVDGHARRILAAALCVACFACGGVAVQGAGPEIGGQPKDHDYVILGGNHLDGNKAGYTYVLVDDDDKTIWHSDQSLGVQQNGVQQSENGVVQQITGKDNQYNQKTYNVSYKDGVYTLTGTDGKQVQAYYYGKAKLDGANQYDYRVRMDYDASASGDSRLYQDDKDINNKNIKPWKESVYETSIKGSTQQQPDDILKKVQQKISDATMQTESGETKVQTNLGETLQNVQAQGYVAAAYDGTKVPGYFTYTIKEDNGKGGYHTLGNKDPGVDPDQFVEAGKTRDGHQLEWNETKHSYVYTYNGHETDVSLDNVYVINDHAGVFYNSDGTLYTGTVYGGSNDYLLTSKSDKDGKLYSYWGAEDKNQTLQSYSVSDFNDAINTVRGNEDKLLRNDINHVGLEVKDGSATISLYRNGNNETDPESPDKLVPGQLTITQGGGTGGIGDDRTLTISSNYTKPGTNTGEGTGTQTETDKATGTVTKAKAQATPQAQAAEAETGGAAPSNGSSNIFTSITGSLVGVESDIDESTKDQAQPNLKSLTINGKTYGLQTKYAGDNEQNAITKNLSERLDIIGGADRTQLTENNIGVNSTEDGKLKIQLAKNINLSPDGSVTIGDVSLKNTGLNNGGNQIHNVASGYDGHLYADSALNNAASIGDLNAVSNNFNASLNTVSNNLSGEINRLGDRVDKVGAGAAALAALHPLDFDPEDKWDFAAGYGHYKDADATAIGVFYRPNEDTLFSVGGSMGGGENLVNAGISFKLGQGSHVSGSRAAMAAEIQKLKEANAQMQQDNEAMRQDNQDMRQEIEALKQLVQDKLGVTVK